MAYGFRARNAGQIVQIDGNYSNYHLITHGTMNTFAGTMLLSGSFNGPLYADAAQIAEIYFTADSPLFAFRSESQVCMMQMENQGGSNWKATLYAPDGGAFVHYYVFGRGVSGGAPTNWGLRVKNTSGAVVYDSRYPPPRVIDRVGWRIDDIPNGWTTGDHDYPDPRVNQFSYGGRKVAVGCVQTPVTSPKISLNSVTNFNARFDIGGWSCPDGAANFHWREVIYQRGGSSGGSTRPNFWTGYGEMLTFGALIIDVTNI